MKLRIFGFFQKSSEVFGIFQISKRRFNEHQIVQLCLHLTDLVSFIVSEIPMMRLEFGTPCTYIRSLIITYLFLIFIRNTWSPYSFFISLKIKAPDSHVNIIKDPVQCTVCPKFEPHHWDLGNYKRYGVG